MSMADKQLFSKDFEGRIGTILTVTQTSEIMRMLAEQLDQYDVEAAYTEDGRNDSEGIRYSQRDRAFGKTHAAHDQGSQTGCSFVFCIFPLVQECCQAHADGRDTSTSC